MVAHVLDAPRNGDVISAKGDPGGYCGDRRHRASAHPVDRKPRHAARQPREQRRGAADGQALITDLSGGGDGNIVHALGRQLRVASHQLPDARDHQIVSPGLGVHRSDLAKGGADAVDEDDIAEVTWHEPYITRE